ncbi:rRNA adenine N-6-methyltransferase family protein [Streptomyces sp. NPDC088812]|uniref:rRNA adenine N-6-methyltransferase family protein n=1 Tax=Streptomyces sp. NPDC088812 TaxID=3365905 RepID=UPI0038072965
MTFTDVEEGRSALGRSLLERKDLSSDWVPSFAAVPRAAFLPDVMWPYDMDTGGTVAVDRRVDPAVWEGYADADVPVVTQWDDRASDGPGHVATSSASMPSVVFRMLRDLDVQPGHRVLEIGTGTGWNAALLAHRLGRDNVVSIEIDATVADAARRRLGAFGSLGLVLTRDGALGDPGGAPYDRVIATAGLRRIPAAWLEQTRPDGLIVAPWGTHYSNADAVARLTVTKSGAGGPFTGPVEFMKLRAQRLPFTGHQGHVPDGVAGADRSRTTVTEAELLGSGRFDARTFAIGLLVRDCHQQVAPKREGTRPVWFYGLTDRSWACVVFRDERPEAVVHQCGPRRLWDEVSLALRWWQDADEPGYERLGLTVTPHGTHRAWLDTPDHSWPL